MCSVRLYAVRSSSRLHTIGILNDTTNRLMIIIIVQYAFTYVIHRLSVVLVFVRSFRTECIATQHHTRSFAQLFVECKQSSTHCYFTISIINIWIETGFHIFQFQVAILLSNTEKANINDHDDRRFVHQIENKNIFGGILRAQRPRQFHGCER